MVHGHHRLVAIVVRSVIEHLEAKVTSEDLSLTTEVHLKHELAETVGHGPHNLCVDFHQVGVHHLAVLGLSKQPEIELVIGANRRLVVLLDQFCQRFFVANVAIQLAEDARGLASLLVRLLKEVRPAVKELVKVVEKLAIDALSMLGKVDCDRLQMSQGQALVAHWALSPPLISQSCMQVADLSKDISLQKEDEVVGESLLWRLIFDGRRLGILAWVHHLLRTQV